MDKAIHRINVFGQPGDTVITVYHWTNDDQDLGYPNIEAGWQEEYKSLDQALRRVGGSRIGVSGVEVEVSLNGKRLSKEDVNKILSANQQEDTFPQKVAQLKKLMKQVEELQDEIKSYVLESKKSVETQGMKIKYYGGRTTYDYEAPAKEIASEEVIAKHTKVSLNTNWKAICDEEGIEPLVKKVSEPSVSFKVEQW